MFGIAVVVVGSELVERVDGAAGGRLVDGVVLVTAETTVGIRGEMG